MKLHVDPSLDLPPSRQLIDGVLDAVARGVLGPGDRLPSVRETAVVALVNPNTVNKAWRELALRGVVRGRNGSGVYVTDEGPGIARELRRGATLAALELALQSALGAGHEPAAIRRVFERCLIETAKEGEQ